MDVPTQPIHLDLRRAWDGAAWLYLVGPGAAGKSTLGRLLAPRLNRSLIDLDEAFMQRIGHISEFIRSQGYEAYKRANSELAYNLSAEESDPAILVTSSGFLALDNPPEVLVTNCALVRKGYCLSLLPALDLEAAVAILVARQMARPFNGGVAKEEATARARFETYRAAGDCLVCTVADPEAVTEALVRRLIDE